MKIFRVLFFVICVFCGFGFGKELSGDEIVRKVNDVLMPDSAFMVSDMTIITSSKKERTFRYESYMKNNGEKVLLEYIAPKRMMGDKTLMLHNGDDIWMYFSRTKRVRKLASHAKKQKVRGSDFSYEDMGSGDTFIEDFDSVRLKDSKKNGYDCYTIEMSRKEDSDISYSKLIMWVIKDMFCPVVVEYYDDRLLLKTLVQSDIRDVDGIATGMKIVMHNNLDATATRIKLIAVKYNINISDELFTERGLRG